jgi:hypothetical protein
VRHSRSYFLPPQVADLIVASGAEKQLESHRHFAFDIGPTSRKLAGVRTVIMVPMIKDGEVVGAIVIYRQEVRTFSPPMASRISSAMSTAWSAG